MLFSLIRFKKERSHRNYFVTLSENEQRLRNNEREREELEECLKEMSLTDEEREEVHSSLMNLMEHGSRLDKENESPVPVSRSMKTTLCLANWNC